MTEIMAADYYVNNARLMEAVAKLWIKPDDVVIDPTYGKGGFYRRFRPGHLCGTDIKPELGGIDFRNMPWVDGMADVVVFDPAYVTPGGRDTSTIPEMNQAYGMDTAEASVAAQWDVIVEGMVECYRVLKPGGIFMQKCMPYISSGRYQNYPFLVTYEMGNLDLEVVDQFMLVKKSAGPQPKNRTRKCKACIGIGLVMATFDDCSRGNIPCTACDGSGRIATVQQHARNNVSFLIVARK